MSVPADRRFLSVTATALTEQRGSAAERRAAALTAALQGRQTASLLFEDLAGLPEWMRGPRPMQADLARRVALIAMGPALARSIDGAWLRTLAEVAGEDALDWALEVAGESPDAGTPGTGPFPANRLAAAGFGIVAATLAPALRALLDWAGPDPVAARDVPHAAAWVAAAQDALA